MDKHEHERRCGRPYRYHLYVDGEEGTAAFCESYAGMIEEGQRLADHTGRAVTGLPCLSCSALIGDRRFYPSRVATGWRP